MPQDWIEAIAEEIKTKNREAAENFGREQHSAAVIADKGKGFSMALVQCLQQNIDALRSRLQGDLTAADTGVQTIRACEVKISPARFPWVDARLEHQGKSITMEYTKAAGTSGDTAQERKIATYAFRVAPDDTLYVTDASALEAGEYRQPEALARRITETLFTP